MDTKPPPLEERKLTAMKNEPLSTDTLAVEIFKVCKREELLRVELQNKCVEMSIHITSGLAAAIAAAIIAVLTRPTEQSAFPKITITAMWLPIVLTFGFYGIIQSMIMTNYIYQTFHLFCICLTFDPVTEPRKHHLYATSAPDAAHTQSKKTTHLGNRLPWYSACDFILSKFQPLALFILSKFQPLALYLSILIAWIVVSVVLLLQSLTILPLCWTIPLRWTIVIVAVLWVWFVVLILLHLNSWRTANHTIMRYQSEMEKTYHSNVCAANQDAGA